MRPFVTHVWVMTHTLGNTAIEVGLGYEAESNAVTMTLHVAVIHDLTGCKRKNYPPYDVTHKKPKT